MLVCEADVFILEDEKLDLQTDCAEAAEFFA